MLRNWWKGALLLLIPTLVAGMIAMSVQAAEQKDIVDTAKSAGSFRTLCRALRAAELVETLQGEGPFTVFAPTDRAFAKLPPGRLEALLADKEKLKGILLYHVVPGKVMAADVVKLRWARTVGGERLLISTTDEGVMIDTARVTDPDISCTNGVIHVIDTVLIPE